MSEQNSLLSTNCRIAFAGTPEFAAHQLAFLLEKKVNIAVVLTQPDRQAGRGLQTKPSPVKQCAQLHQIPTLQPLSLKRGEEAEQTITHLKQLKLDLLIVAAYGLILPKSVLDIPRLGCVNVHASLLPRWRGAAPINRAIEAGDTETGICLMKMDEGLDTGDILSTHKTPIDSSDTAGTLEKRLSQMGAEALFSYLKNPRQFVPMPQPNEGISYAHKIKKEECVLDWKKPAQTLVNHIRSLNPISGLAVTLKGDLVFKVWKAEIVPSTLQTQLKTTTPTNPGTIVSIDPKLGFIVSCGVSNTNENGMVRLTELQKPGGKRMADTEFLKGLNLDNQKTFDIYE
jgi:methionyl-tRNA formyltransferase